MSKGKWITIEGIGGSGKSTLIQKIHDWIVKQGMECEITKEPGGTEVGMHIRGIVKSPREPKLRDFTELMLFEADRHETYMNVIVPGVTEGKIVLSDRGIDGTLAYQGFGRGVDLELIDHLTNIATQGRKPDVTLLIDIDPRISSVRMNNRQDNEVDQFDLEALNFQENVRDGFLFAAQREPDRVHLVDGSLSEDEVLEECLIILKQKIFATKEVLF